MTAYLTLQIFLGQGSGRDVKDLYVVGDGGAQVVRNGPCIQVNVP